MRIKGSRTTREEFDIDVREVRAIAANVICKILEFNPKWYINSKGGLCEDETFHTSHSWTSTEVIRKATQEDMVAVSLLKRVSGYTE